jgi:hypothetical protein
MHCDENFRFQEDMVLAIESTRRTLVVLLYRSNYPEGWHDGGILHIFERPETASTPIDTFWEGFKFALKDVLARAPKNRIDFLLVSGERGNETTLHEAIQEGLGVQFHGLPFWQTSPNVRIDLSLMADPTFAAAQGAAELSWQQTMEACLDPCSQWTIIPGCQATFK